jgi:hypothetical protein
MKVRLDMRDKGATFVRLWPAVIIAVAHMVAALIFRYFGTTNI